jgi:hypothetical protein
MKTKIFSAVIIALSLSTPLIGQTDTDPVKEPKAKFKVTSDLVSSYIWRGTLGSHDPSFQPTFAIVSGGLEAGVWGSTNFSGTYKELDPYIFYTTGPIKFGVTDYNWTFSKSYFDYKNSSTDHIIEGTVGFAGTENLPLTVTVNTMVYGADKKYDFDAGSFTSKQNYSTYIEFGYSFGSTSALIAVTPSNGYYGAGYGIVKGFAVCNLGLSSTRNISITPSFELPLKASLFVNPQAESIHFVIGITL